MGVTDVTFTCTSCHEGGARSQQAMLASRSQFSLFYCKIIKTVWASVKLVAWGASRQAAPAVTYKSVGLTARNRQATGWWLQSLNKYCFMSAQHCRGKPAFLRHPYQLQSRSSGSTARSEPPRGTEPLPAWEAESHRMQKLSTFAFTVVGSIIATKNCLRIYYLSVPGFYLN